MTLAEKTKEVIKDSIKSAIFIDEKAQEFFSTTSKKRILEEKLSRKLYSDFRNNGISLDIHKFVPANMGDSKLIDRINNKDLVLLDWDLDDGVSGNKFALSILSEVVDQKHIHFCSIYTSSANIESITDRILVYFSGYTSEYYQKINDEILDIYYDDNKALFDRINIDEPLKNIPLIEQFSKVNSGLTKLIISTTGIRGLTEALIQIKYAMFGYKTANSFDFAEKPLVAPENVNKQNLMLNLNNTIVTIIPKSCDTSQKIISKLSSQVRKSENVLMQLIGLDMQNSFAKNSSFIDKNVLNVHKHSLMHHRKTSKNTDFQFFVKSILAEQAYLTLESSSLKTLDDVFLDKLTPKRLLHKEVDLANLNAFYNGTYINKKKELNFGDILIDESTGLYYLCITPLCDCLHPLDNIKNNFFFVNGSPGELNKCLGRMDSGFQSYILEGKCIEWTTVDYIKPIQLHISDSSFVEDNLQGKKIIDGKLVSIKLNYVFSLRQQYAQRIANHTFSHPLRVGVDFVKIN